jgi:hypothetical protein
VAMKACCNPKGRMALAGVMAIDTRVAGVTVRGTPGAVTPKKLAPIEVVPTASAVTKPLEPVVLSAEATVGSDDVQVTAVVRLYVELSENTTVAVNC